MDLVGKYYPANRIPAKTQYLVEGLFEEGKVPNRTLPGRQLDATAPRRSLLGMDRSKKKLSDSRDASKKGTPPGMVIALAVLGGVIIGSAGTYMLVKPSAAPVTSAIPASGGNPQAQSLAVPSMVPAATLPAPQQSTGVPQPPGEAPPGKVWSPEHGHWHDAPGAVTFPAPVTATPVTTPTPAPPTATPAAPPAPAPAVPPEKKE